MYKIICLILVVCLFTQLHAKPFETDEQLYEKAVELFYQKKYTQVIKACQKIEDLYPLSYWAVQAKLLSGTSNYAMKDYISAINDMEIYISMYPSSDYAYYLRILAYYKQINNRIERDQQTSYKALELAIEYVNLFPESEYISDVKLKIKLATERIIAKEHSIGEFYFRRGEYVAAIKRFQNVISYKDYNQLSHSAITYLIAAYSALGLNIEAQYYAEMQ